MVNIGGYKKCSEPGKRKRFDTGLLQQMTASLIKTAKKYSLTLREMEVMSHIAQGKTSKQIATVLFISDKTVDNHRTNIRRKTGCCNAVEIALFAMKNGVVKR